MQMTRAGLPKSHSRGFALRPNIYNGCLRGLQSSHGKCLVRSWLTADGRQLALLTDQRWDTFVGSSTVSKSVLASSWMRVLFIVLLLVVPLRAEARLPHEQASVGSELLEAAAMGNLDLVASLIAGGADLDTPDGAGRTALMAAARMGHVEIVQILADAGADIDAQDKEGRTVQDWAAGRYEVLRVLGSGGNDSSLRADEVLEIDDGVTMPVVLTEVPPRYTSAARRARLEGTVLLEGIVRRDGTLELTNVLQMLGMGLDQTAIEALRQWTFSPGMLSGEPVDVSLNIEVNFNLEGVSGDPPQPTPHPPVPLLILAALTGDANLLEGLIEEGADLDVRDEQGNTPLHAASQAGQERMVELLLAAGARTYLFSDGGTTALIASSLLGYEGIVERLLDQDAELGLSTPKGVTALMAASQEGHEDIVKLVLERGASIDSTTGEGTSALFIASLQGHKDIVERLLEHGARTDLPRNDGVTPLISASVLGHEDVVKMLLEKGASVNAASINGATPLISASQAGHEDVVKLLLRNGADVNLQAANGATALAVARAGSHDDIVGLLQDSGAIR